MVPAPINGSRTTPPAGQPASIQVRINAGGKVAKCAPLNPRVGTVHTLRLLTDVGLQKWKEVKRRESPKRSDLAKAKLHILTGTGNLGRSIKATHEPGKVTVFSDVPYAAAHNEGTTNAGRNRNVTIPKRQFIGDYSMHELTLETHSNLLNFLVVI